jgi:hypothetical protein
LTIKSKYAIIKEKEKEKNMKKNLEIVVAELEKALEWNSGVIFGLHQALENDDNNDRKNYELNQCEKKHTKLFNALVIAKKLLKEINQELKKGE